MESTHPCRHVAAAAAPPPPPPPPDETKKFASESTLIDRTSNERCGCADAGGLDGVSSGGGLGGAGGGLGGFGGLGGGLGGGFDGGLSGVCARAIDASDARRMTAIVIVDRARWARERRARGDMGADDGGRPNERDAAAHSDVGTARTRAFRLSFRARRRGVGRTVWIV